MPALTRVSTRAPNRNPTILSVTPGGPPPQGKYNRGGRLSHYWHQTRQGKRGGCCISGTAMTKRGHHQPCDRAWKKSQKSGSNFIGEEPWKGIPSYCWYSRKWLRMDHPVRRISQWWCGVSMQLEWAYLQGCKWNI